jgi:hypothetical protein
MIEHPDFEFQVILPNAPRVPFYIISIILVSIAILNTALVMRLFQVKYYLISVVKVCTP